MKYIDIADTKIPALGFGTWQLRGRDCEGAVSKALEIGYRHIDTAQIYANEDAVGAAIKALDRKEIFLTTKIWITNVAEKDLGRSFGESLQRLKTDYVDLLLIHWPNTTVPFSEQINALMDVYKTGAAKMIGVSNFTVRQMKEIKETLGAPIVNNQVEYNPFLSQAPILGYVQSHEMFLTAYTPVARGKVFDEPIIKTIAQKYNKSPAQIALRWLIQQDKVAAIPKAAKEEHIKANFDIFDFELSPDETQKIFTLAKPGGRMFNPALSAEHAELSFVSG